MKPPSLAQILSDRLDGEEESRAIVRPNSVPLLKVWPEGYENARFRLDGDHVLIFAEGSRRWRIKG